MRARKCCTISRRAYPCNGISAQPQSGQRHVCSRACVSAGTVQLQKDLSILASLKVGMCARVRVCAQVLYNFQKELHHWLPEWRGHERVLLADGPTVSVVFDWQGLICYRGGAAVQAGLRVG